MEQIWRIINKFTYIGYVKIINITSIQYNFRDLKRPEAENHREAIMKGYLN